MSLTVAVIPAFNEEKRVALAVQDALSACGAVVVVDDCSTDRTNQTAYAAGAYVLRHVINRGQGAALETASDFAVRNLGADIVVHFDADGQMTAADIPYMIEPILKDEADVVLGSRFMGKEVENMPASRRAVHVGARLFTLLMSGIRLTDTHNGFRALSKDSAKKLRISLDRMAHASEILDLIAARRLRVVERPVTIKYTEDTLEKSLKIQGGSIARTIRIVKDLIKKRLIG
ncbi:MAG: glycosyltransferase family 2 protein [Patescibacteria group bacterium]